MKAVFILLSIVAITTAGVLEVTPEIEMEAWRLWNKFCVDSDDGVEENTYVYCKRPKTPMIEVPVEHVTTLPDRPNNDTIVVFVKPPSYHYKHNVTITGESHPPKTVIYVKPVQNNHTVSIIDNTTQHNSTKPRVYYLQGDHGVGGSGAERSDLSLASAPAPAPQPTEIPAPQPQLSQLMLNPPQRQQQYFNGYGSVSVAARRFNYAK